MTMKRIIQCVFIPVILSIAVDIASAYEITHALGKTVIKSTKRVVILTNEGTEALLALGVKPIGAVNSWIGDPWYPHIADKMKGVTPVGKEHQVDVEAVAELEPDVIIANKLRQGKIADQLSAIAPTVWAETLKGQWKNNLQFYAKVLKKETMVKKLFAEYHAKAQKLKDKKIDEVVAIIRFLPNHARIYQVDSFSGVVLSDAGFTRAANALEPGFTIKITNKERIPEMDADRIFFFTYDDGNGKGYAFEKEWMKTSLWKNLSAVKKGNVHRVNDVFWNTSGGIISANIMLEDLHTFYGIK